ncbi:molybdopterin guanine dinucleotide synthesis [Szabonella alba]|uniref:molybdopterin guanine dinucleotide synthesis n=1 Tax=Szabonella alba TaxID=2804194 RepID=UPI001F376992|nr:molybdopterin guanine dinucleotide synthesis [Szabonella alba]
MAAEFDTVLTIDWSGGGDRGLRPVKDAIWACAGGQDGLEPPVYLRNRQVASDWLTDRLRVETGAGRRVLLGFDFPFGYPAGFAAVLTGRADPLALWDWFAAQLEDGPEGSNRFELADRINAGLPGLGPFWFNGTAQDLPHLPRKGRDRQGHGLPEKRLAERAAKGAFTCWQMGGAGAVGSQAMTGIAALARLRVALPDLCRVWPFEVTDSARVVLVEIWPSLAAGALTLRKGEIKDAAQVRLMTDALLHLDGAGQLRALLENVPAPAQREEGWILGLAPEGGADAAFADACARAARQPRRMR